MINNKKRFYFITDDLMFKMNLEKNLDVLKILARKYIEELKDWSLDEKITLLPTENNNGINIKSSTYDLKFKALDKSFDFEMQGEERSYNLEDRFLKYYGDLIVRAYPKGESYKHDTVYNLWILNFKIYEDELAIHTFKLKDKDGNVLNNSGSITVVEIEKFKNMNYNVDIWDKLFMANEIKELDSLKGADKLMDKVIKTCHDINDDSEMWRLLDEDHARRNIGAEREAIIEKAQKEGLEKGMAEGMAQGIKQGIEKGMAQGMAQGIEQGIEQGEKNKAIEIAKNAKKIGLSLEQIIKLTGLSKEEIKSL